MKKALIVVVVLFGVITTNLAGYGSSDSHPVQTYNHGAEY